MKISFNKKLSTTQGAKLTEGRYVGTIIQIAVLGKQPGYNVGEPPTDSVAVVVQLPGAQIAKKMRNSKHTQSALFAYLDATLPDPEGYEDDDPLPLTLGRTVAIEVTVNGRFANIASFHRPETFELASAPKVVSDSCLYLDDAEMTGDAARTMFLKLHRDVRGWLSRRIRG